VFQIRASAFLRSLNFLTGVPAMLFQMLFQMSTNRLMSQPSDSLTSAGSESNWARSGLHALHRRGSGRP
jgi:hypothetical protein